jgi:urea transporter
VLLAALRRLAALVVLGSAATAIVSLPVGLLLGSSPLRSLTIGFYLAGCFLMVIGFFAGNRGPTRVKSEAPGPALLPFTFSGRRLRWATQGEQHETINNSAVFVSLGLILVVIGLLIDPNHALF